jgi:predicted adenylyl cyclase CyaB
MNHVIIEFKARCDNHNRVRSILRDRRARYVGADHQVDTYFHVPRGRLKLREGTIENSLIFYSRPDLTGLKQSDVTLAPLQPNTELRTVLAHALGVLVTVDKEREIYFVDNVKVHLDQVQGLGAFLEVEAIGALPEKEHLEQQCQEFLLAFGVREEDFVAGSYSDLLLESATT